MKGCTRGCNVPDRWSRRFRSQEHQQEHTDIFSGDSDEIRWVRAKDLPKESCIQDFCNKFAIVNNGPDGRPDWYGCPRSFHRLTMSWYLNDPKEGGKPNVRCDENYEFWASRPIKRGEELTVDSTTCSDHAKLEAMRSKVPLRTSRSVTAHMDQSATRRLARFAKIPPDWPLRLLPG
jgi:hypothetical protein